MASEMLIHKKTLICKHKLQTHLIEAGFHLFPARLRHCKHIPDALDLLKEESSVGIIEHEIAAFGGKRSNAVEHLFYIISAEVHTHAEP